MKTKDLKQLHTKTLDELKLMVKEAKDALFSLEIEHAQKKLKNTSAISNKKKEIAQILTIAKGKEIPA